MTIIKDKVFYKNFLLLTFPMAIQNLITSSVNLVDNIMVGQLGTVAIAAVGLANKVFFVYSIIIFGICGGSSAFVSQFWGKKDISGIKKILYLNLLLAIALSLVVFLVAFLNPELFMRLLTNDPEVIITGVKYLKLISLSYILSALIFVFSYALKSLEHPKIPLIASVISIITNASLNYIFIFGKLGFPAMGVKGAAIATVTARVIEAVFIIYFTFSKIDFLSKNINEYFGHTKESFIKYIKNVIPVVANETLWSLGTTAMAAIYARVSTAAIASVNIVNILFEVSSIFLFGASQATGILVGKEIGAKRVNNAYLYANRLSVLIPASSFLIGLLIIPYINHFLNLFNITDDVRILSKNLYSIMVVYLPFRAFNHVNIVGSLRSGGDTLFCLICDVSTIWIIGVLFSYIAAINLRMPMEWVYIISQTEEFVKSIVLFIRIKKRSWIKDLVNN